MSALVSYLIDHLRFFDVNIFRRTPDKKSDVSISSAVFYYMLHLKKNRNVYSDSIRGASKYVTCPFLSAISNSTLMGLSLPSCIVIGSSPLTDFTILLK